MDLKLKSKVAIVTGASRGIGRSIAERLSAEGMRLVLAARSEELMNEIITESKMDAKIFAADLRSEDAPQKLIDFCIQQFGGIDLLVNNAGATKRGDFLHLTEADWTDGFGLKFYSTVRCCRAAWPHLKKSKGSVVNIIGIGGRTGSAEFTIGGTVNAAVLNLTKALADRGVTDGVKVNAINPGSIMTERLHSRIHKLAAERMIEFDEAKKELEKSLGVSRFGEPEEIASAVAFLASEMSSYCQGAILDIDGGQTRTL